MHPDAPILMLLKPLTARDSGPRHRHLALTGFFHGPITELSGKVIAFSYDVVDGCPKQIYTITATP